MGEGYRIKGYEEVSPTAAYLRYLYALDTGRWSEARGHLQQALWAAQPGTPLTAELALEAAFFEVAIRCDAQQAQRWLEPARRTLDRGFLQAVQAAVGRDKPAATRAVQRLASRSGVDAVRAEKLQESLSRCPPSP